MWVMTQRKFTIKIESKGQREKCMFKKIIVPLEELQYRQDGIDNKYIINEGSRALGLFAGTAGLSIPAQISPQDICFFVLEGKMELSTDDKVFMLNAGELLLIPKTSAFTLNFVENSKVFTTRL